MNIKKDLLNESIAHYDRMIKWSEMQEEYEQKIFWSLAHEQRMYKEIGETWAGNDCPLCRAFSDPGQPCPGCPIALDGHAYCKDTPWHRIKSARSKLECVDALRDERSYLKTLYDKEPN
jgi:hypothetical protein